MIPLAIPNLAGRELEYLEECISTNFVSSVGPFVDRFESEFAKFLDIPYGVAASNGTAAIHTALVVAGVERGDEVWVSDFTFAASANPILYQGATPVLVDSELSTWNMNPDLVVEEMNRRSRLGLKLPKAILAVHILGCPANILPIFEACEKFGVTLIEDAAEALGASYTQGSLVGRQVGTIGQIGCFSFNGNKIITSGGGGMLVTRDPALAKRAKHLTTQAKMPGVAYMHDQVGYNYRLTNLAAALGLAQLEQLDGFLAAKRRIADKYRAELSGIPGIDLPPSPVGMAPTGWLFSVLLPGAWETWYEQLNGRGIQTRPLWTALHLMQPFASCSMLGSGSVAEDLCRRGISLPCSTSLLDAEQDAVISAIRELF